MFRSSSIYISLFSFIISFSQLYATPEFSLWSGNKCNQCHNSQSGGGSRTEFGFQFAKDASYFPATDFKFLDSFEKNSVIDSTIYFGLDFRYQSTRAHKLDEAVRKYYPMQASGYLNFLITEGIFIDLQYNAGPKIFYGQQPAAGYLFLKPWENLPFIKAGFFMPSIGLRDCDMTDLDRRTVLLDGSENLIAPDFAEWGAEIGYSPFEWIDLELGCFDANSLNEVIIVGDTLPLVRDIDISISSRFVLWLNQLFEDLPQTYIGASNFTNSGFTMNSVFLGTTFFEDWLLQFKFTHTNKQYSRLTYSYIGSLSYVYTPGLIFGAKYQFGSSNVLWDKNNNKYLLTPDLTQVTLNARWFITPFIEFIPEYRYMKAVEFESFRWLLQLHLYI